MIEDLIEKFTIKTEKTIHFTTDLKTEKVYADEEFLKEAISNLIDNAIKYSKESVKINISSSSDANHDIINIYDNGIGIPQKTKRRFSRSLSVHRPSNKPEKEALQDSD